MSEQENNVNSTENNSVELTKTEQMLVSQNEAIKQLYQIMQIFNEQMNKLNDSMVEQKIFITNLTNLTNLQSQFINSLSQTVNKSNNKNADIQIMLQNQMPAINNISANLQTLAGQISALDDTLKTYTAYDNLDGYTTGG